MACTGTQIVMVVTCSMGKSARGGHRQDFCAYLREDVISDYRTDYGNIRASCISGISTVVHREG